MIDSISEIRVEDFIMSLSKELDNDILSLKGYAISNDVPIIRDETKSLIRFILTMKEPKSILEIGTAIAYSTLVMHRACKDANIVTVEDFPRRIKEAKSNIEKYFDHNKIELVEDDATNFLKSCDKTFDFVFLDAAKGQYISWLKDIKRIMKKGAILLADNVFKDGEILESRFLIKKRDRTIHKRMRDFLYEISNDKELSTYIYNIGDGVSISIKK